MDHIVSVIFSNLTLPNLEVHRGGTNEIMISKKLNDFFPKCVSSQKAFPVPEASAFSSSSYCSITFEPVAICALWRRIEACTIQSSLQTCVRRKVFSCHKKCQGVVGPQFLKRKPKKFTTPFCPVFLKGHIQTLTSVPGNGQNAKN